MKGFCDADEATMGPAETYRDADLELLRAVIDQLDTDDESALDACEDMQDAILRGRIGQLSDKQRAWLERTADKLDLSYEGRGSAPTYASGAVPEGRPV